MWLHKSASPDWGRNVGLRQKGQRCWWGTYCTRATGERAADAMCTCEEVKSDDETAVKNGNPHVLDSAPAGLRWPLLSMWWHTECHLNVDKAMPSVAALADGVNVPNPLSASSSPLRIMWPSQSTNSQSQSQASLPQQAQRAGTHTNKVEGHFSNCCASQAT